MSESPNADGDAGALSPAELAARLDAGESIRLLDVRNRDEFESWHVAGPTVTATQIPNVQWMAANVQDGVGELAEDVAGEGPITVVCGHGEASDAVADLLTEAGVEAHNLAQGMRGWARVLLAEALPTDGSASVVQYHRPASGCLSYLVVAGDEAAVVDPLRAFTERYVADAADRGVEITTVIDTHVHADHLSGLRDLVERTEATAVMPRLSVKRGFTAAEDVDTVVDGDEVRVGDAALRAVHLPGHTSGMTAFAVDDVLLSGDSLFLDSVARPDLQHGADGATALARQLYGSLTERLADLPDETVVAPGHVSEETAAAPDGTYTATLGTLRDELAVFSMDRERFVVALTRDRGEEPANFERIVAANLGRAAVADDEAFELELGPNNCAANPSLAD
jgi:glyoxylase-like metal-dependent hydrolase (beta-lactamase superfamily II)/rhodanese-related sulfurtransferase